ncbi:hypothetical protein [Deinococcus murrayi]|uniref:hypothetical protein n=1 Tax=Deinococcus murrayi TaxID=68910 RepID=UPI000483542E|nr:hypothetical protein [Deinococcus murrayi]
MSIKNITIGLQNAVVTDGTTITGDGTEGNPLTAHLTGGGSGAGLPSGGSVGQVLTKTGPGDGEAGWVNPVGGAPPPAGGVGPVYLQGGNAQVVEYNSAPRDGELGPNRYYAGFRLHYRAQQALAFNRLRMTWHSLDYTGNVPIEVHVTGPDYATSAATVQATGVAAIGNAVAEHACTLDGVVNVQAGQYLVIVVRNDGALTPRFATSAAPTLPAPLAGGLLTYIGAMSFDTNIVGSGIPLLAFLGAVAKGVLGPLDPIDVPRVSDLAHLPNGGQALYIGVTPPRPVYRAPDGTLYYGPAYSTTP